MLNEHNFEIEYINKIAKNISDNNIVPYEDLPRYDLFLSQVTDYLNDKFKGEKYTNNIVQNYIKMKLYLNQRMVKERLYQSSFGSADFIKLHEAYINYWRDKKVFRLAFNEINDGEDDIISWENAYKIFSDLQQDSLESLIEKEYFNEDKFQDIVKDMNLKVHEEEKIMVFLWLCL